MNKSLFLTLIVFIFGFSILSFIVRQHYIGSKLAPHQKMNSLLSESDKQHVLGREATLKKTYTSLEGKYSVVYPGSWIPSELPSQDSSGSGVPVFTVGPVGNKILGYPSFIQISTLDNPQNFSLDAYVQQNFDKALTFTPMQIASYSAEKTTNLPSSVPTDSYFIANNTNIYEIRWFHGSEPKISDAQFQTFLTSISFQ